MASALDLLNSYESDSSDAEDVKPSSTEQRLPLPNFFNDSKVEEHEDDPALYDGRIRSFAHERGNWATYVFIPYEPPEELNELVVYLQSLLGDVAVKGNDHYHISLSKTVTLKYHWINEFVKSLSEKINFQKPFNLHIDSLKVYCNEERTRTFLGVTINDANDDVLRVVQSVDACLEDFRLPTFYHIAPSFHISIAWSVGDYESLFNQLLPKLKQKLEELLDNDKSGEWPIKVQNICCKVGNKLFTFGK